MDTSSDKSLGMFKRWLVFISVLAFSLSYGPVAFSRAGRGDLVPGSRYTSGRGAAMGDAAIPLADDVASGLFYTPAGLAKVKDLEIEPMNLGLQINSDYLSKLNTKHFYQVTSLSQYANELGRFPGYSPGVSGSLLPSVGAYGFGAGLLVNERIWATSNTKQALTYRSLYQLVPAVGYGANLGNGIVRLGYSLQWVSQASGTVTTTTTAAKSNGSYSNLLGQGSGFSNNFGMAVTLPWTYLPQFDFVARNVGGLDFSGSSLYKFSSNPSKTSLPLEPMSFDVALSYLSKTGAGGAFDWTLEYRDMTDTAGVPLVGRLALGVEFEFRNSFFLRGGWGSGMPCLGLGIKQKNAEISLAWFGEDIGGTYHEVTDRRYMLQYIVKAF